ncbi:MAG: hypothetical protein JOY71_28145 [Acetobacteraceae bacterium]|nr:hypothetical protein [Acetobacteraceae bacterium]MBV8525939.1 hypothetical protein [Acetobacteraceae bacterium]MBV8590818.1 hypothetical protein [Acetobacteraceae bacterium]
MPWLYVTFGVAFATGILLFFYDPVHVGSHGYFTLKLILLAIGLANAALFRRTSYVAALAAESAMPLKVRIGGAVSLAVWVGVMACACLNTEGVPKVFLR